MTLHILDYSWARPSPQSIVDFPAIGVMRYVGPGNGGRDITTGELQSLHDAGLGVGLVWESTANRALDGYDAGAYDASQATYYANRLGWPGLPIYYACDCDVSTSQAYGQVLEYFRGTTAGGPYAARAYGEADVLDAAAQNLGMRHGWQPASTAWSGGRLSVNASMYQQWPYVMNDQCDDNFVLCANDQIDWLWGYGGLDMPLTQDDLNSIKSIVDNAINAALGKMYTGARALQAEGDPGVFEIVVDDGQVMRRYIPSPDQIGMLQWTDHLAGDGRTPVRVITDPAYKREFLDLPVVEDDAYARFLNEDDDGEDDDERGRSWRS